MTEKETPKTQGTEMPKEQVAEMPKEQANKTLANCSLREFLAQTNKIRKDAAEFLELTEITKIRKHVPVFTGEETEEEKKKMFKEQGRKNFNDILDSCLEKNADATIKMVGLMCFKTFEEAEQMKGEDFIAVAAELFGNKKIMDFFSTLLGLVQ